MIRIHEYTNGLIGESMDCTVENNSVLVPLADKQYPFPCIIHSICSVAMTHSAANFRYGHCFVITRIGFFYRMWTILSNITRQQNYNLGAVKNSWSPVSFHWHPAYCGSLARLKETVWWNRLHLVFLLMLNSAWNACCVSVVSLVCFC